MAITNDRRVGIRTTSPSEALHVNGRARSTNLTVDNQAYIGSRVGIGWTSNWHQNLSIRKGLALQSDRSTGAHLQMYLDGNDDIRWDVYGSAWVNRLFMDKDNGRMGLGTTAPLGQLHVNGVDARSNAVTIAGSVPGLYFHDTESQGGAFRYSSFMMEADGNRFYIGSRGRTTSGTIGSGSRRFTIDDNGKVGIMTSNPAEELDVRLFRRDDAMCVLIDCDGFKANHFHPFDYSSNAAASRDVGGWVSSVMVHSARWFEDAKEFGVEIFHVFIP